MYAPSSYALPFCARNVDSICVVAKGAIRFSVRVTSVSRTFLFGKGKRMDYKALQQEKRWNEAFFQKETFEYLDAQEGYDPLKDANSYCVLEIDYRNQATREAFSNMDIHTVFCRMTDRFMKSAPDCFPNLTSCENYMADPTLNRFYHLVKMGLDFVRATSTKMQLTITPKTTGVRFVFTSEMLFLAWNSFSFLEAIFQQANNLLIIAGETGIRCGISFSLFEEKSPLRNILK